MYLALLTGRDPVTMVTALKTAAGDTIPDPERDSGQWPWSQPDEAEKGDDGDETGGGGGLHRPNEPQGPESEPLATEASRYGTEGTGAAPFGAVINLLVPAGTLFGNGTAPGEIPGYGPVDPETTRDLVQMASAHPQTRWCVTTIGKDGTATEHGCVPGQHRWTPPAAQRTGGGNRDGPGKPPEPEDLGPGDEEHQLAAEGFLARLPVKLAPIAAGTQECDHTYCTERYEVPRRLKHLVKARKATCVAPCCSWPAADGDADHTIAWPQGPTCQDNLGAPCRYHHRNKQAHGWKLGQNEPGMFEWTGPSGRRRTTTPATYLA